MAKCFSCEKLSVGKSKYCSEHREIARVKWLEMIRAKSGTSGSRNEEHKALYEKAYAAGMEAGKAVDVAPMIVAEHENQLDDNSPVKKSYFVPSGPCGFAWIVVRPGNCSFALWAKKNRGAKSAYGGGTSIWVSEFGQSMARKEAYAYAFAKVLHEAGIKAYADSRMD